MYTEQDVDLLGAVSQFVALAIDRKKSPDIILANGKLLEMTGFEFARRVRNNPDYSGIPIILLTSGG